MSVINWVVDHKVAIFAGLFFISEALALIPSINANSVFQAVFGFLKKQQPSQ